MARKFHLHVQCSNCQRPSTQDVVVPAKLDAPTDVDEFVEQLETRPVPFHCRHCDSSIGELVGVTMEKTDVAA